MTLCAYCGIRPGIHKEHVVPRMAYKRLPKGAVVPPWLYETVRACGECNLRKFTRLLVPPSWNRRLPALNALGIGIFRVWDGDVRSPAFTETHKGRGSRG